MNEKVKAFNKVAGVYDDWYEHPQGKQVFQAEKDAVDHMIPEVGIGLEIGSGTGAFTKSLENEERVIIGLDPSIEMVSKAWEKKSPSVLGYGDYSPFRKVFDFSYMVTVIEFLRDPIATLRDIRNVCKEDTPYTLLFINSESSWGDLYRNIGSRGDPVFRHARLFSLMEIKDVLEKSGYTVVKSRGTLSSDPMSQEVQSELIDPSTECGVIVVKAFPKNY